MGKKERQQDLKRRLGQRSLDAQRSREELAKTLSDPQRFAQCLQVFSSLAVLNEGLYPCRYDGPPFLQAVLDYDPSTLSGEERVDVALAARAFRDAVIPGLRGAEVLDRSHAAIQAAMEHAPDKDVLIALTAAGALLSSCRQEAPDSKHPFWDMLFELTLTDAILSGALLIHLVREAQTPDPAEVGKAFAKALATDEGLSDDLDRLGLDDPDPSALAANYAAVVADPNIYHLQLDAVLHLARTHVDLAGSVGRRIPAEALSAELREAILQRVDAAYAADVTEPLVKDLTQWFKRRLVALNDEPESLEATLPQGIEPERKRCLVTYLALRALPLAENHLLRALHAQSLERCRTQAPELEQSFVHKLWGEPTDLFTLEAYETFLLQRNETNRSRRVRDYREAIRAEQAAAKAAAKAGEEPTT